MKYYTVAVFCWFLCVNSAVYAEVHHDLVERAKALEVEILVLEGELAELRGNPRYTQDMKLEAMLLPQGATEDLVREYVYAVLVKHRLEERDYHRATDVEVAKLMAVGPQNAYVLLEYFNQQKQLDIRVALTDQMYIGQALSRIAPKQLLPSILKSLDARSLMTVILERGWLKEATPRILELVKENPDNFEFAWLRALVLIKDESSVPYLKDVIKRPAPSWGSICSIITKWTEVDWTAELIQAWGKPRDFLTAREAYQFQKVVAGVGEVDALLSLVEQTTAAKDVWVRGNSALTLRRIMGVKKDVDLISLCEWIQKHKEDISFDQELRIYLLDGAVYANKIKVVK